MNPSALFRLYARQFNGSGYDRPASGVETLNTMVRLAAEDGIDDEAAARVLRDAADRFDVSVEELVAAAAHVDGYTTAGVSASLYELERVLSFAQALADLGPAAP